MVTNTIGIGKSLIDKNLHDFVNNEIIPGTNIDPNTFWKEFIQSANQLASKKTSFEAKGLRSEVAVVCKNTCPTDTLHKGRQALPAPVFLVFSQLFAAQAKFLSMSPASETRGTS